MEPGKTPGGLGKTHNGAKTRERWTDPENHRCHLRLVAQSHSSQVHIAPKQTIDVLIFQPLPYTNKPARVIAVQLTKKDQHPWHSCDVK